MCIRDSSIPDLLKLVGLENTGKKKAKNFSLGMKQRLGIAVACLLYTSFYAFLFNLNSAGQTMGGSGKDRVGSIEIYKYSDHPAVSYTHLILRPTGEALLRNSAK